MPPLYNGSGWKFKLRSFPTIVEENVPIPEVLPIERNGYCVLCVSVSLCATKIWCSALVDPLETLTILFKLDISSCKKVAIVAAADTLA